MKLDTPFIDRKASPSLRGRGLKYLSNLLFVFLKQVALFTRAWIEIALIKSVITGVPVALFTRAWIEIFFICNAYEKIVVALFTRAWIEIPPRSE